MKENLLHNNPEIIQTRIETMRALSEEVGISPDQQDDKFWLNLYEFYLHEFMRIEAYKKKKGLIITKSNQRSLAFEIAADYADKLTTLENNEHTDPLTGVANRGGLDVYMDSLISNERGGNNPKGLFLFLDIDNFREFNDRYNHVTGDMVLKRLAAVAGNIIRAHDLIARYGGDEFAIVMPFDRIESQPLGDERLNQRAEQIFSAISEALQPGTSIPHVDSLTISMGAVLISPNDLLPESVYSRASEALKQAKTEGKNKLRCLY